MTRFGMYQLMVVCALGSICLCNTLEGVTANVQDATTQMQVLNTMKSRMENVEAQNERLEAELKELKALLMDKSNEVVYIKGNTEYVMEQGPPGPQGPPGSPGVQGCAGKDGVNGVNGLNGRDGDDGEDGKDGDDGKDGRNGINGIDGVAGPPGAPGFDGENGLTGPKGDRGPQGQSGGGAVYIRWGRTTCGDNSTLIYDGFAGVNRRDQPGGGVNYQCMPWDPEYNKYISRMQWAGTIAGAEYETYNQGLLGYDSDDQGLPCAVCYASNRPSLLVIPAKRNCPSAWHREYEGYLMSETYEGVHPSTFECVSEEPEYVPGQSADISGAGFYFNKAVCNKGVFCPPYADEKAITCVVCTK